VYEFKLSKSKSFKPNIEEVVVFINVKIEILNEFSKSNSEIVNNIVKRKKEITNINKVKKYLCISFNSRFVSKRRNLFVKT
tara:strand:+ start:319 stop:561 length:243 start_codon:yes stop_codon:yes gene_type:complete